MRLVTIAEAERLHAVGSASGAASVRTSAKRRRRQWIVDKLAKGEH